MGRLIAHARQCADPNFAQWDTRNADVDEPRNSHVLKINEFQLCKKAEIQQEKIEIQMRIQSAVPDDDIMDDCVSLTYSVEFGELHERDKYQWVEVVKPLTIKQQDEEEFDLAFKKMKVLDFEFKMNHIK